MALYPCRECGRQVSSEALSCPQCGVPAPTQGMTPEPVAATPPPLPLPGSRSFPPPTPRPAPAPPSPRAREDEPRAASGRNPLLIGGGIVALLAIFGIATSRGGSAEAGSSAFAAPSGSEAADRARDSTEAAGLRARLASASRADLMRLDGIEHRWSLPHDSATHARAQTAMLDSVDALLDAKVPDAGGMTGAVLAQMSQPLTARQAERGDQLRKRSEAQAEEASRVAAAAAAKAADAGKWSYSSETDPMTGKASRWAVVQSENTVDFSFPYNGPQHASLTIRNHPSYGRDVILQIQEGQILCPSYDDCTVRVRFDDGAAESWTAAGAADHSSTSVFIRSGARFLQRMRAAKVVRIQIPVYQEGNPAFEFRVGGYDHERYTRGG